MTIFIVLDQAKLYQKPAKLLKKVEMKWPSTNRRHSLVCCGVIRGEGEGVASVGQKCVVRGVVGRAAAAQYAVLASCRMAKTHRRSAEHTGCLRGRGPLHGSSAQNSIKIDGKRRERGAL